MKHIFFSFLFLLTGSLNAQNLVPNWSFEDTVACPEGLNNLSSAKFWSIYRSSPDFFNKCSSLFENSIPNNALGYQDPLDSSDHGYSGLVTFMDGFEYREYLGCQLLSSLIIGQKYFVSLKVSLADSSACSSNNIGIEFSTISYVDTGSNPNPTPIFSHSIIYSNSILSDKFNWINISGSFFADSNYEYLIIGNFFTDSLTNIFHFNTLQGIAYYYVDKICVSTDSFECDISTDGISNLINEQFSIYPNPANDKIIINKKGNEIYEASVFDIYGREIKKLKSTKLTSIDVLEIPNGIYLLKIKTKMKTYDFKQIILH